MWLASPIAHVPLGDSWDWGMFPGSAAGTVVPDSRQWPVAHRKPPRRRRGHDARGAGGSGLAPAEVAAQTLPQDQESESWPLAMPPCWRP